MADALDAMLAARASQAPAAADPLDGLLAQRAAGRNVAPVAPIAQAPGFLGSIANTVLGGVQGLNDVINSGAQALQPVAAGVDAALSPLLGESLQRDIMHDRYGFASTANDAVANQEAGYRATTGNTTGAQYGRLAGNITGTIPLAELRVAPGMGLAARIINGAAQGGAASAALSSNNSQRPLGEQIGTGMAFGALGNAVLPPVIEGVSSVVSAARSKLADIAPQEWAAAIRGESAPAIAAPGAPAMTGMPNVPTADKPRIRVDASGQIVPDIDRGIATPLDFQQAGMTGPTAPTAGQQTRSPSVWTTEQNLAKANPGGALNTKFANQNQAIQDAVSKLRDGTGATAKTAAEAGQSVTDAIQAKSDEMQQTIGGLYKQIQESPQAGKQVVFNDLPSALADSLHMSEADPLTGSVLRKLSSYGVVKPGSVKYDPAGGFNFEMNPDATLKAADAEDLRKFIGNAVNRSNPTQVRTGNALVDALDNDVVNSSGIDAFAQARDAARSKFQEFSGIVDSVNKEKINPDDVLRKVFTGGKTDQIDAIKKSLTSGTPEQIQRGTAAFDNIRGQVVDQLMSSGVNEAGKWNQTSFAKALDNIGPDRLKRIFTPDELAALGSIRRAGTAAFADVPFSSANHSNSGPYLEKLMQQANPQSGTVSSLLGQAPVVGGAAKAASSAMSQRSVNAAEQSLSNYSPAAAARFTKNKALRDALSRLPVSSATSVLLNQGNQ